MVCSLKYVIRLTIQLRFSLEIMALLLFEGSLVCFPIASHYESKSFWLALYYDRRISCVPIHNLGGKEELSDGIMSSMKFPLWYHQKYFLATAILDFII